MKVIELKDVKKSYGKNEILHGISLDIEEGSIHGLVGRRPVLERQHCSTV